MKCQLCSNPATYHLTNLVKNQKQEVHLCERCAEEQQLTKKQTLNLAAIAHAFDDHLDWSTKDLVRMRCPQCGIGYMEFRSQGRLGCPNDYALFQVGLKPLLEKIHGNTRHQGKVPQRRCVSTELVKLRTALREAVEAEHYEEAARIRDLIREKEATDEPG